MRSGCLLLCLVGGLVGCRAPAPSSPDATFALFDQALRQGDYTAAAECIDFDQMGRGGNSDWDSFPASQQHLIASKMKEDTIQGLAGWGYPAAGMTSGPAQVQGDQAMLEAKGGGKTLKLTFQQSKGAWKIVGGVPGMTSSSGMSGE